MNIILKICKMCKDEKPKHEFNGQSICRPCKSLYDKEYRHKNRENIRIANAEKFKSLSDEEKKQRQLNKKRVEVTCSQCNVIYKKASYSIPAWNGMCKSCSIKSVSKMPHMKEVWSRLGREYIKKYGSIPSPKMENRRRGETHYNWGKFRENSPCWIADRTKLKTDDRRSIKNNCWVEDCKKRDGYKCKIGNSECCGQLEVHHILSWKDHPELRHDLNNGITLCHFHHPRKRAEEKALQPYFKNLLQITS